MAKKEAEVHGIRIKETRADRTFNVLNLIFWMIVLFITLYPLWLVLIASVSDPDAVFAEFDRVIGLDRLKAVHLNNSLNGLGSHKDRHAKIREGTLPEDALVRIVCHKALAGRPFILETPNDDAGYAAEIAWLREQWEACHE